MAKIKCECHNYGECDIADNHEILEVENTEMECPECHKPLYPAEKKKKSTPSNVPVGLIIGIIAFLIVGGLAGGGIWAYNSGMLDKFLGRDKPEVSRPTKKETENKRYDSEKDTPDEPETSAPILIEELAIDTKDFTLTVGEKKTVTCTATPANNEETVTWKSSDESIATVDAETGEVKAIKAGSANIMAQTDQSGLSKSVMVTVKEKAVTPPVQPSWGRYSGERNKNGKPHGQGVLTITRSHTINGEQALVGETITGVFKDGYVNMGKWNKLDGNVVIVKDLKIL